MTEIARRSFLFGMAATLASVAVAKPALLVDHVLMPAPLPFKVKRITELMVALDYRARSHSLFSLFVADRQLLQGGIQAGGTYQWWAMPGEEIIQRAEETLRFDLSCDMAEAMIISQNENNVAAVEIYRPGKPVTFQYLDAKHG